MHVLNVNMHFFATENGQKSDSMIHIPNLWFFSRCGGHHNGGPFSHRPQKHMRVWGLAIVSGTSSRYQQRRLRQSHCRHRIWPSLLCTFVHQLTNFIRHVDTRFSISHFERSVLDGWCSMDEWMELRGEASSAFPSMKKIAGGAPRRKPRSKAPALSIFQRSVLGRINADFCNQIVILQHFSRSTRFSYFAPLETQKVWRIFAEIFS